MICRSSIKFQSLSRDYRCCNVIAPCEGNRCVAVSIAQSRLPLLQRCNIMTSSTASRFQSLSRDYRCCNQNEVALLPEGEEVSIAQSRLPLLQREIATIDRHHQPRFQSLSRDYRCCNLTANPTS